MTSRVEVRPELLAWAVERSGRDPFELWTKQMSEADYQAWLTGERRPTVRQLQNFASKTYTPYGFLLLAEPPAESLPVTDFRRPPGEAIR
ncbi:MAG TPA: DNA-binding protein, partial [Acidimicrobiaceae bacterium]|nr:DNA-binding protein [Acidimicrobiaceae bacterium]